MRSISENLRSRLFSTLINMIRKATVIDVKSIHQLINRYAKKDLMLPRSLSEIYENLRDYWIFEEKGKVSGCGALHICWENLAEIKSLAVLENKQRQGIGRKIVEVCIQEAREFKIKQVFALTFQPRFFKKCGFRKINKNKLPEKIWGECIRCSKFPGCNEEAFIFQIK
jgi:amino-acid N-acetyltransferase